MKASRQHVARPPTPARSAVRAFLDVAHPLPHPSQGSVPALTPFQVRRASQAIATLCERTADGLKEHDELISKSEMGNWVGIMFRALECSGAVDLTTIVGKSGFVVTSPTFANVAQFAQQNLLVARDAPPRAWHAAIAGAHAAVRATLSAGDPTAAVALARLTTTVHERHDDALWSLRSDSKPATARALIQLVEIDHDRRLDRTRVADIAVTRLTEGHAVFAEVLVALGDPR